MTNLLFYCTYDFTPAPDLILTAAHCQQQSESWIDIVLEPYSLVDERESKETFVPKEFRRHPDYGNPVAFANDFQLISFKGVTAKTPVTLQTNTTESELLDGQNLTVFGFGTTVLGTFTEPDVLQRLEITALNNSVCQEAYEATPFDITRDMLCMENDGSCNGDSGGPLIIEGLGPFKDVQVGIVSWGIGCRSKEYPGELQHPNQCYTYVLSHLCRQYIENAMI
jgi:secreted trypsin-like serine protease